MRNRKLFPYIFCFFASLCVVCGCWLVKPRSSELTPTQGTIAGMDATTSIEATIATDYTSISPTYAPGITSPTMRPTTQTPTTSETPAPPADSTAPRLYVFLGYFLFLAGVILAIAFIFFFRQEPSLLGPDAELPILFAAVMLIRSISAVELQYLFLLTITWAAVFICARGLWGWICSKCPLSWCLIHKFCWRVSGKMSTPQWYLILQMLCGCIMLFSGMLFWAENSYAFAVICLVECGFNICSVAKLGNDLDHLTRQLSRLTDNQPINVRNGLFAAAEESLQSIQEQNAQAIQTAVVSERFRVDLISNVSHDLRTPLTSIIGYGELLQKQTLSPEGICQLNKLNQKAGYMKDLVDSLFELTKISSGAVDTKNEHIDLIRLLEQTIGLYDDKLSETGLTVKRHYTQESLPVVTDGARMHQVFANLLGNAIKYALPGTRIHLQAAQDTESCTVRITNIASYEMDFTPEEIVQRFARGDKARTTKGSGIGLAIAQTYTESVGGQFKIEIDGDQFRAIVTLPKTERNL